VAHLTRPIRTCMERNPDPIVSIVPELRVVVGVKDGLVAWVLGPALGLVLWPDFGRSFGFQLCLCLGPPHVLEPEPLLVSFPSCDPWNPDQLYGIRLVSIPSDGLFSWAENLQ
jgi:hypothetical protein